MTLVIWECYNLILGREAGETELIRQRQIEYKTRTATFRGQISGELGF